MFSLQTARKQRVLITVMVRKAKAPSDQSYPHLHYPLLLYDLHISLDPWKVKALLVLSKVPRKLILLPKENSLIKA